MASIDIPIVVNFDIGQVEELIKKQLTENDYVEVVRCKDCKSHRELNRKDWLEGGFAEGVLWCMNQSDGVWPDDFCSYGERKEGEADE